MGIYHMSTYIFGFEKSQNGCSLIAMFLVVWKPISPDAFHTKFTPSYERTSLTPP